MRWLRRHGYHTLTSSDVADHLAAGWPFRGRPVMITFDDGYYNNTLALPVLKEFDVPALFFISTTHVRENKCYWWDVLYRERTGQGVDHDRIESEARTLKQLRTEEIESRLKDWFGPDALTPRSDIDRPFSPEELKAFAADPHVFLGNHTANHAILINYTPQEVREQILGAQESLHEMTGVRATAIAYPNGALNEQVINVCASAGLQLGFTVRPEKRILPIDLRSNHLMRLGRFTPHSHSPIPNQCRTYRSDVLLYGKFRDLYLRLQGEARVTN